MVKREENEDNICHWEECLLQYDTADDLFNHICTAHIGRKSAGTLSLECKWTGCRAKASKRDHLTSHCRVHVALKPHVCSICTKAFKRPQDLKKHEKIHTEEHQAQHQRVSKAAAAGMNGNPPAGKLGAQARTSTHQGATASTAPSMPQLPAQYPFSFPAFGFGYPGLAQANGQPQQAHHHPQAPPQHANSGPQHHQQQQQQHQQQPGVGQPQFPVAGANADQLAQFIALQQQLNSQAQMAAATGLSLPSQAIPGLQANLTNAFAMQLNQMLGGQAMQYLQGVPMMYPYGNFGYGAGGAPLPQQQQQQHQQVNGSHGPVSSGMPMPGMPLMSQPSSQPQGPSSLYPSLPPSLYGSSLPPPVPAVSTQQQQYHSPSVPPMHHAVKPEEHPSPASSSRSRDSGSYSSSLSPRNLPALSPASSLTPEHSFSPTPGPEQQLRKLHSDNQVVGKKRGFEEATGQLLNNLSNKRFQDQDAVNAQLDSLSTFLLTPDTQHHSLPPYGHSADYNNNDDSASSSGSEHGSTGPRFEHEDVDAINQLLLSLNQSLDSEIATSAPQLGDYHLMPGPTSHSAPSAAASYAAHAPMGASLYPSLPAGLSFPSMYGQPGMPNAYDPSSMSHHAKSVPAPSLAHDYRPTQYHHVTRLQRAAPSSSAPPQIEPGMEIDDDVKDAAEALLLAGSINRAHSVPSSKPSLPSLSTTIGSPVDERVRLPPIARTTGASSRLPPIRDLLSLRPSEIVESPTSPVASTSSASSTSATPPLYPSLSSLASSSTSRPVSAGGVERLTHRVHKLRLPSTSSSGDEPTGSFREDDADLSASSGEEDEDRPTLFKKSRVESPIALSPSAESSDRESATPEPSAVKKEEEDDDDELVEAKAEPDEPVVDEEDELARQEREAHIKTLARRKAVIAYLAIYVNHKYREQLARKSMAQVRKAIKKPSPLSQESQLVKVEN
ncbi:hypothetical protein BMF94_3231 [Rhodotorula taiwanensis]|uniref:C2H2-type domain-containing protein n=1 Tax=Rhodotorula taiwanensis TaxID=741276 RepID=A0A2S5BA98_9BASI|nr:hypothetical protein BMF94_3231 [Rhodotorula taiwanensis]